LTDQVRGTVSSQLSSPLAFAGFGFPAEVIMVAVRWYPRY
jgi:transposase-like protein